MQQDPASPDTKALWIEVVTDTYAPDINGVALSLGRLCTRLRDRGHRVEIVRSGLAADIGETAIFSCPLPGYSQIKVGLPWLGQLRRRWEMNRPDLVYIAIESPLGLSAASTARKLRLPVIGGFHTNFAEYLEQYGVRRIGALVRVYQKWFHQRLHRTLAPSPDVMRKLTAEGFSKVSVLGRGVDNGVFSPTKRSTEFRHSIGAMDDKQPVAIVVGRISPEKNIELAIRAFARMKAACPGMISLVVGDGPLLPKLQQEFPDILFPGFLTGEALATCYASADIMLFPSETETFGNVLIEGMASGLAIVAYDHAAARWHGIDGVNLLKVEAGDEEAFLVAAQKLLDPECRLTLGMAARGTAMGLDWSAIVDEMEGIFRGVIDEVRASAGQPI